MRMNLIVAVLLSLVLFSGCETVKQMWADKQLSDNTPLTEQEKAEGKILPNEQAARDAQPLASLPYGAGIAVVPIATWLIGAIRSVGRGRKLRAAQIGTSANPITGHIGEKVGAESFVQHVADVSHSIFGSEKNLTASATTWRAIASGLLGSATIGVPLYNMLIEFLDHAMKNPPAFLQGPILIVAMALGTAAIAFIRAQLAKVKPVEVNPATPAPVV